MEKITCSKNNGKELQFNCAQYRETGSPEGSTYMPSGDNRLTRWILEALSELTTKQTEEFLSQVSQQGFLRPESSDPGLILQPMSQE